MDNVREELMRRVRDPADVPRFERLYKLIDKRVTKLGPSAGVEQISPIIMKCWRRVFGVEWPRTKPATATPTL